MLLKRYWPRKKHREGLFLPQCFCVHNGLTTNPTLLRKAGVLDYEIFARSVLEKITTLPISFEVFSDDLDEMISQGQKIAAWGENVYVKIPITNTKGKSCLPLVKRLVNKNIRVNMMFRYTLHLAFFSVPHSSLWLFLLSWVHLNLIV